MRGVLIPCPPYKAAYFIRKQKVKQEACFEEFVPEHLDTKGWLSDTDNMRSLFESQRPTDGAFRIVGAVAIDGRCSVFYVGSIGSLFGRFQRKGCAYGIYAKFA